MGLRFVIGRAGTGKTHLCAGEIVEQMRASALGENLLWIVPEQATFMTERLLLATGARQRTQAAADVRGYGTFRTQVLSFSRLAMLMGRELGLTAGRPMEDLARRVLVEEILRDRKKDLQLFSTVAQRPGFAVRLDATLRELRQHQHTGESLRELRANERIAGDAILSRKLHDLALLLDAYATACTSQKACDAEMVMHAVALRAGETRLIGGDARTKPAIVWVDGLSALNVLEQQLLMGLAQHAQRVTVTLLADPDSEAMKNLRAQDGEGMDVFARPERLYRRLLDEAARCKVRIEAPVHLRKQQRLESTDLVILEHHLSRAVEAAAGSEKRAGKKCDGSPVCVWECSDPETEVRAAAQWIRARVAARKDGLRYRNVGVIVPQIDAYEDAIRRIFTQHKIPHFVDQRKSVAHHPVVELVRSAVAIVAESAGGGWDRDDIFVYLKTGLAQVDVTETARIENYVLQHGLSRANWSRRWEWVAQNRRGDEEEMEITTDEARLLAEINAIRERVWKGLQQWVIGATSASAGQSEDAARYVTLLRELLVRLDIEGQVMTLADGAMRSTSPGAQELAQVHLQAWRGVQDVLDLLEGLLKGRMRTLAEFSQLLNTALEGLTLGLIPPTVDQVLISSVSRSRVPEMEAVLILGAVEGAFPRVVSEDPILTDAQRELLNDLGADSIGIGTDRQLLEERFFDYMAMTRARSQLVLSYPLADRSGKALRRSQYVSRVTQLLGDRVGQESFDAARLWRVDHLSTVDDLMSGVVTWVREEVRARRAEIAGEPVVIPGHASEENEAMRAAYNWVVAAKSGDVAAARDVVWDAIREAGDPALSPQVVAQIHPKGRDLRLSISQLEKFAGCPLQFFLHYTLGLREREELELDTLKLGIFYHHVLENVFKRVLDGKLLWPDCTEQQLRAALNLQVDATALEIHPELAEQTPGYALMQARAKRTLGIVLEAERRRAMAGRMRPIGVEVGFGGRSGSQIQQVGRILSLPVLHIDTPRGTRVALNGKIDRVDSDGRWATVMDYKSASVKKIDWPWVHAGLMLQLPAYALVIEELANLEAAAALYMPLGMKREAVKSTADVADADTDDFFQKRQPSGVINGDAIDALDVGAAAAGKSDWYSFRLTKAGDIDSRKDALRGEDFRAVLDFVRVKLAELADALAAGTITPRPYQAGTTAACDNCDFASLCPFDRSRGEYLVLPKISKNDFVQQLHAAPSAAAETSADDGGRP